MSDLFKILSSNDREELSELSYAMRTKIPTQSILPVIDAALSNDLKTYVVRLPYDYFREIPIRYLGYGFAFGRAISYQSSAKESDPFYLLGTIYVISHCIYRLYQVIGPAMEDELGVIPWPSSRYCAVAIYDTLIWDFLASFAVPSCIIYWVCWATECLLDVLLDDDKESSCRKWLPVTLSLLAFPFLVRPVDNGVDRFMTVFIRPIYDNYERVFFTWIYTLRAPRM